jgi:hypothetical protein
MVRIFTICRLPIFFSALIVGIVFGASLACAGTNIAAIGTLSPGQCNLNSGQCATSGGGATIASPSGAVTSSYNGTLSQGTAVVPVNVWNSCYYIDNSSANPVFVPFKTSAEWTAFINNKPNAITLTGCGVPYSISQSSQTVSVTPPYAGCNSVNVNSPTVYERTGTLWPTTPLSQTFTCGGASVTSALQWTAGNFNTTPTGQLSWAQSFKFSPNLTLTAQDTTTGGVAGTSITIASGDSVELTWSSSTGYGAITSNTPSNNWNGVSGATVQPTDSTTYTLTSTDSNGLASTATVTVNVGAPSATCPTPSVAHGSVSAYPDCEITCDSGYTNISGACVSTTCPGGSWPAGPKPYTGFGPYGFVGSVPAAPIGTRSGSFSACSVVDMCEVLQAVCGNFAPGTYSGMGAPTTSGAPATWAISIASPWAGGFFETIVGNPPNP